MNIIYIHGFQSSPKSIKAQQLQQYCAQDDELTVHVPDLNMPPEQALQVLQDLVLNYPDVALIGSSLGGFYATQLVAKHNIPAVLINPAMRPWLLFRKLFAVESVPYPVTEHWTLDNAQLQQLEQLAIPFARHAEKVLVLLQQGDEVLDYREAQRYYSAPAHSSLIMTEAHGSHGMDNFAEKLPMVLEFLSYSIK